MNQWKGSFYFLFLSTRREYMIFWTIYIASLLLCLMLSIFFPETTVIAVGVLGSSIFTFVISIKLIDRSLSMLLRYGADRRQYMATLGVFIVLWSLSQALPLLLVNTVLLSLSDQFGTGNLTMPTLAGVINEQASPLLNFVLDTVLLCVVAMFGLIINSLFYRYGVMGGYGFIGVLAVILIVAIPFDWYSKLAEFASGLDIMQVAGVLTLLALLIYSGFCIVTNKISAISASA